MAEDEEQRSRVELVRELGLGLAKDLLSPGVDLVDAHLATEVALGSLAKVVGGPIPRRQLEECTAAYADLLNGHVAGVREEAAALLCEAVRVLNDGDALEALDSEEAGAADLGIFILTIIGISKATSRVCGYESTPPDIAASR